jgi:hypothetical protein
MNDNRNDVMNVSDEQLMAYADGELAGRQADEIGRAIERDPGLARRLKVFQATGKTLSPHFSAVLEMQPPAEMLHAIRGATISKRAAGIAVPLAGATRRMLGLIGLGPSPWPMLAGIAAGVVIGAMATWQPGGRSPTSLSALVVEQGPLLLAAGPLVETLEARTMAATQLESGKVYSTFQVEDGSYCRYYETANHSGIACRKAPNVWQIVAIGASSAGAGPDKSTIADGGGARAVADLATTMTAESTAALDAEAEAALIARAWEAR